MRLLSFLFVLAFASVAQAQTVRVVSDCGKNLLCKDKAYFGSATLVGYFKSGKVAILSCAHVFDANCKHSVEIEPKKWIKAEIVAIDRQVDLCLLSAEYTGRVQTYPISDSSPKTGEVLLCRGYPMMKELREQRSQVVGGSDRPPLWKMDSPFISGESGGSVICATNEGGRTVGVIVASDDPGGLSQGRAQFLAPVIPPGMKPAGYVVPWPVVAEFVRKAAPEGIQNEQDIPQGELGEEKPFVRPEPPKEEIEDVQEKLKDEYSKAKIIVLINRQGIADIAGSAVEKLEGMASSVIGDYFIDKTDGAADVEVVFERMNKARFDKVRSESGVLLGDYASVVILVKKQDAGLMTPMKKIAAGIAQRSIDAKLGQLPAKVIFEREYPERFRAVEDAMSVVQDSQPKEDGEEKGEDKNLLMVIVGLVLRYLREGLPWMRKKS